MTKLFRIGNDVFEYPQQGTGEGHGEDATAWAEAVTNSLANFLGPNDLLLTTANLANGVLSPSVIPGLTFNTGQVQHTNIEFLTIRIYDDTTDPLNPIRIRLVESGKIFGNYNGSDFRISIESVGDNTGIEIDVNNNGQFVYTSTDLSQAPNVHISSTILFKASTIDS